MFQLQKHSLSYDSFSLLIMYTPKWLVIVFKVCFFCNHWKKLKCTKETQYKQLQTVTYSIKVDYASHFKILVVDVKTVKMSA